MSSYVNRKIRVFKEAGDIEINRKRSDGRMKTYTSATDARAWCDSTEERRQHILDLIKQGDGKGLSLGKYIPIDAIIDILLSNKNEDIKRLQKEIDDLKRFIKKHGLQYDDKKKPPGTSVRPQGGDILVTQLYSAEKPSDSEGLEYESAGDEPAPLTREPAIARGGPGDEKGSKEGAPGAGKSDEKTAVAAGRSDQKGVVGAAEAYSQADHAIALEAIEKLETIKAILEEDDVPVSSQQGRPAGISSCKDEVATLEREISSMKSKCSPEAQIIRREVEVLKKYCSELAALQKDNSDLKSELLKSSDAGLKNNLNKLDEITQERDRLKARVEQLENELRGYGNLPQEISTFKDKARAVDKYKADESELRGRLDKMRGLEDEVRRLKQKSLPVALEKGDYPEKDELLKRIADLERETDNCKRYQQEIEILKVERKCRLADLDRLQREYQDLLKKTQGFDCIKAECAKYKTKYEELKNLENECNDLRAKVLRVEQLENERQTLKKEIEDCECCMNTQEAEIKKLACHIDCLTHDLDKRQQPSLPMQSSRMLPATPAKDLKVTSMKKIMELENKLLAKQEYTKEKINNLQSTVDQVRRELELERQRNDDLSSRYTNQSKTVANMKIEMDMVRRENDQDKRKLQHYETMIGNTSRHICSYLPKMMMKPAPIPHFHTELTLTQGNDARSRSRPSCNTKRTCSCKTDLSSDSFEIDE